MRKLALATLALLVGCGGDATWETEIYGEPYIEEGIPASEFADGCSATFDQFLVVVSEAAVIEGGGAEAASLDGALVFDVTLPGPHTLTSLTAPAEHYDTARFRIGPATGATAGNVSDDVAAEMASSGNSVHAIGTVTCGGETKTFDWTFDTDTTYDCEPEDLTLPAGGSDMTQLTVHGDHFFYDGLENDDAEVRAQAIVDADADADGAVTQAELAGVSVAPLGYQVGSFSSVTDMRAFLDVLTQTLGHVDGEGHCNVTRN